MLAIIKTSTVAALLFTSQTIFAAECSAKSGVNIMPLLELYTSEGCSSCPPADKWLSGVDHQKVTPLAFHVDYWNYIGWNDRFSKAEYSDRQRKLAAFAGAGFVYTPQFVLNGHDFRGWDNARLKEIIAKNQQLASRADLSLNLQTIENVNLVLKANVEAFGLDNRESVDIFLAIYENSLVTQVKAGENNGSTLKQDYVVREFFGAYSLDGQRRFSKNFNLSAAWKNKAAGAAIFVQNSQTGEILQSLALPFRSC